MATITVVASGGTVNYKYVAVIAGSTPAALLTDPVIHLW
jgi:hypothetical protein